MTGRAKGRARGRARGGAADADPAANRPGSAPQQAAAPAAAVPPPQKAAAGRATQRGGTRAETRPGDISAGMRDMSLEGGDNRGSAPAGGRGRGRNMPSDEGIRTRQDGQVKQGTAGQRLEVVSNYFKLKTAPDWQLYQYHVYFSPEVESKNLKSMLVKQQREMLGTTRVFDGATLYLAKRLPQTRTEVFGLRKYDNAQIKITFDLTAEIPPSSPMCIQIYNVIFRRILNIIEMQQIGRHYYDPKAGVQIPRHKLEIWPGFITSITQYEQDVMLCSEISHKILRSDNMLNVMQDVHSSCRQGMDFHDMFQKKYIGEIVLTPYNNKTYRVDDVDWTKNPMFKFKQRDGTEITLAEYYQKQYDLTITDKQQPLLVSQPKKRDERRGQEGPILLVPELCRLTGLSDEVRADFHVMKDLAEHTRVSPEERFKKLRTFNHRISSNEEVQKELSGWRLGFDQDLVNINARILPSEKIFQPNNRGQLDGYSYRPDSAEWSREMRNKKLIQCVPLPAREWVLMTTRRDEGATREFLKTLRDVAAPMGMQIGEPEFCTLDRDAANLYDQNLQQYIRKDTKMVVCVVPNNRKDRYDAIKKRCCLRTPVPSQVIVTRTLMKKGQLASVATKIAIQMNCKLGGEVWAVDIPLNGLMVIGYDTYHDSAKKGRSVGAFVASVNKNLTRYYSRVTFQTSQQELNDGLRVNMQAALRYYNEANGSLPGRILVYRDGVGDGQLQSVVQHEVEQVKQSLQAIGSSYEPKLSVIVVKKRINTRFFARSRGQHSNPPPGSVVDSVVTKPEWFDFFLVSQSVRQGTVTPTHYNIVWDTNNLGPDKMQRLTYKLTHLYYNWPGTIRVPAPCQYAHKLAFLVGQSLHEDPRPELHDKLFYL